MKRYISLILILLLAVCCKKEQTPSPSKDVPNPYARTDNANSPLDHAIYQVYQSTGVPIFYTDTIVASPLQLLPINLESDVNAFLKINYLHSDDDLLNGVALLRDSVLPLLGDSLKPFSILLTDSIFATPAGSRSILSMNTYLGISGLVLGNVGHIKSMPADTLKAYKLAIIKSLLQTPIAKNPSTNDFYAVSYNWYGKYVYGDGSIPGYVAYAPKEQYGFLAVNYESSTFYQAPSQADDVNAYLNAILSTSADDFTAKYNADPLVMKKYNILVQILKSAGFKM
jgi:hypothetical protein